MTDSVVGLGSPSVPIGGVLTVQGIGPGGIIPTSGGGGGGGDPAVATALAPTYVDGATVPLSTNLAGATRVTGPLTDAQLRAIPVNVNGLGIPGTPSGGVVTVQGPGPGGSLLVVGGDTAVATEFPPTYVEGDTVPLSTNLAGDTRVIGPLTNLELRETPVNVRTDPSLVPAIAMPYGATSTAIVNTVSDTPVVNGIFFNGAAPVTGAAGVINIASIENPLLSTRRLFITRMQLIINPGASAISGIVSVGRATGLPTLGTVRPSQGRRLGDGLSVAIVRSLPTAVLASGIMFSTLCQNVNGTVNTIEVIDQNTRFNAIDLGPGAGLVVYTVGSTLNQRVSVNFEWIEATS